MSEIPSDQHPPRPLRTKEYEDPHYHNEDEYTPGEEGSRPRTPVDRRKALRKWAARRHFED
jgi:hypothetical protein